MLNFGLVLNAILLVLGILWCKEMLGRWRTDWERLRESNEKDEKLVILFLWVVTAVILYLVVNFVLAILGAF